jgi:RNA polymerase sigma factor (sigma-70 family)
MSSASEKDHSDLVRRVVRQEPEALAELYDCLAGPLYSIAVSMLNDAREAEEVLQDVFLHVWNRAGSFDRDLGTPFQWMARMTRNRCIDYLRARRRRARLESEVTSETEIASRSTPRN